jgi:hypothetical protein
MVVILLISSTCMYTLKHDWAQPTFDHFLLDPHEPGRNRDFRILLSEAETRLDEMVIRR